MKFKVFGDYGYNSENELYESDSQNDAVRWLSTYIQQCNNMGGYNILEVAYFANDGEYVSAYTVRADGESSFEDCSDDDYSYQSAYSYNI